MAETMERIWIRIPVPLKEALEAKAKRLNLRFQDVARMALALEIDREPIIQPVGRAHDLSELADHLQALVEQRSAEKDRV